MAAGYIPRNDAEFLAWMNNFISVLNANLATFGLVAADLTPLTNARNDFQTKLGNFQTAETAPCPSRASVGAWDPKSLACAWRWTQGAW